MADPIRSYKDLIAWQKAYALGIALYHFTARFPEHERFGLTASIRRSAILLARQIAEGYGKQNTAMYVQSLRMARGTTYDLDTQIAFASGLTYASEDECTPIQEKIEECGKVLSGLIRSIESSQS